MIFVFVWLTSFLDDHLYLGQSMLLQMPLDEKYFIIYYICVCVCVCVWHIYATSPLSIHLSISQTLF